MYPLCDKQPIKKCCVHRYWQKVEPVFNYDRDNNLFKLKISLLAHKISQYEANVPEVFQKYLMKVSDIYSHNARYASNLDFHVSRVGSNYGKHTFRLAKTKTWEFIMTVSQGRLRRGKYACTPPLFVWRTRTLDGGGSDWLVGIKLIVTCQSRPTFFDTNYLKAGNINGGFASLFSTEGLVSTAVTSVPFGTFY